MTPEKAREAAQVMLAYADGAIVECQDNQLNPWIAVLEPSFNWIKYDYRIKPKPIECWVVVYDDDSRYTCHSKEAALDVLNRRGGRLAHLVEAND